MDMFRRRLWKKSVLQICPVFMSCQIFAFLRIFSKWSPMPAHNIWKFIIFMHSTQRASFVFIWSYLKNYFSTHVSPYFCTSWHILDLSAPYELRMRQVASQFSTWLTQWRSLFSYRILSAKGKFWALVKYFLNT